MTEQEKRKQVAKISIFITSIFVIFLSISYAFINQTLTGIKRQVITAGNLQLSLTEGDAITLNNALPMYDEVGMIQKSFDFTLQNRADVDTDYVLKLVDVTSNGTQKLDTSLVKYGLEKDETLIKDLLSNLTDGIIDSGTLTGNEMINYCLRLWIDSEVEDEALIKNKSLSYRIDVEASQEIQVSYTGMMKKRNVEEVWTSQGSYIDIGYADFYQYSDSITNIVLENRIHIPSSIETDKQWDMSEKQDGSVMAYIEENDVLENGNVAYKLHIQSNSKIRANEDSQALFYGFSNLETITGFEYLDISNIKDFYLSADVSSVSIFGGCPKLNLDLSKLNTSNVTNMEGMFYEYNGVALDLSNFNTSSVTNMSHMFENYKGTAALNLSSFDTSSVTNMSSMFSHYSSSQPLDLSSFNTSNVTNMSSMFSHYSSSQPLDLSHFNTSNVTDMFEMFFYYNSSHPLDLSSFDTSKVTNMYGMFSSYSSSQPLDLSHFNTSKVTNMANMFSSYSSSQPLDLSSFDTSNVTDMSWMFDGYSSGASLDISSFDTSNVTYMPGMFYRISKYYGSPILVKDEAMRAWVLEQNSDLTNVTIKGA